MRNAEITITVTVNGATQERSMTVKDFKGKVPGPKNRPQTIIDAVYQLLSEQYGAKMNELPSGG